MTRSVTCCRTTGGGLVVQAADSLEAIIKLDLVVKVPRDLPISGGNEYVNMRLWLSMLRATDACDRGSQPAVQYSATDACVMAQAFQTCFEAFRLSVLRTTEGRVMIQATNRCFSVFTVSMPRTRTPRKAFQMPFVSQP